MELSKTLEGVGGRYEHILLFEPLCKLNGKKNKDFPEVNVFETTVTTLVFFLDEMLRGNRVTANKIEVFLKDMLADRYDLFLTQEEARKLRVYIVDNELRNEGRDFTYEQFDAATMEQKKINFKYITRDISGEESYLKLTEKGIEMLFKTREIFSDERINFTVIYFKQQLNKENFNSSLELARSLLFEIKNEIDRLEDEIKRIKTNVISAIGKDAEILRARNQQMKKTMDNVKGEFRNLTEVVNRFMANENATAAAAKGQLTKKQFQKLETLNEIASLIDKSNFAIDSWTIKCLEMVEAIDRAFESILLTLSDRKFDIESEVLMKFVEKEIDSSKLNQFLLPTYPINIRKEYNPMRGFLPQKIRKEKEIHSEEIETLTEEQKAAAKVNDENKARIRFERNVKYAGLVLHLLPEKTIYRAKDLFESMQRVDGEAYNEIMTNEECFTQLMFLCRMMHNVTGSISLHPMKQIEISETFDMESVIGQAVVLNPKLRVCESFEFFGTDKKITLENGYQVTDFLIVRGEE